jgi:hypothetical protein
LASVVVAVAGRVVRVPADREPVGLKINGFNATGD